MPSVLMLKGKLSVGTWGKGKRELFVDYDFSLLLDKFVVIFFQTVKSINNSEGLEHIIVIFWTLLNCYI